MDPLEEKTTHTPQPEVIALPPLRMVLVHAKDEHLTKAALVSAIRKISADPVKQEDPVEPQTVKKIIQYLEKES